jgi:hypothetical protein
MLMREYSVLSVLLLHCNNHGVGCFICKPLTCFILHGREMVSLMAKQVAPTPCRNPRLVAASQAALDLIDLPASELQRPDAAEYFSGNKLMPGADPHAHCYCGHQFGRYIQYVALTHECVNSCVNSCLMLHAKRRPAACCSILPCSIA